MSGRQRTYIHNPKNSGIIILTIQNASRRFGGSITSDIIRIWFEKKGNQIDEPSNAEQSGGEDIHNTEQSFLFIELMGTKHTQQETKEEGGPFIFGFRPVGNPSECIDVIIVIVDNDRLRQWLHGLHSRLILINRRAAERACKRNFRNFATANRTENGFIRERLFWLVGGGLNCSL